MRQLLPLLALAAASCTGTDFGFVSRPDPGYCGGSQACPPMSRCHSRLHYCYAVNADMPVSDPFVDLTSAVPVACSSDDLIQQLSAAAQSPLPTKLSLAPAPCTYTLSSPVSYLLGPVGLPTIVTPVTVEGNGAIITRSSAPETPTFRLFAVEGDIKTGQPSPSPAGSLTLRNLTLTNGYAMGGNGGDGAGATAGGGGGGAGLGGAIVALGGGELLLDGVTITGCTAQGGDGGGFAPIALNGGGGGGGGSGGRGGSGGNGRGGGGGGMATDGQDGQDSALFPAQGGGAQALDTSAGASTTGTGGLAMPSVVTAAAASTSTADGAPGGPFQLIAGMPTQTPGPLGGKGGLTPANKGGFSGDGGGGGAGLQGGGGGGGGLYGGGGDGAGAAGSSTSLGGGGGAYGGGGGGGRGPFAGGGGGGAGGGGAGGGGGESGGGGGGMAGGGGGTGGSNGSGGDGGFGGGGGGGIKTPTGGPGSPGTGGGTGSTGGGGGLGGGGAVFVFRGSVVVVNSTLSGNFAIGGNTLDGSGSGSPGSGRGGAIYVLNSSLTLLNATLVGNTAARGTTTGTLLDPGAHGYGGALYANAHGAAVNLTVTNTIMADSLGLQLQGDACAFSTRFPGSAINTSFSGISIIRANGSGSTNCAMLGTLKSYSGTEPLVGDLLPNGGPTPTRAPLSEVLLGAPALECGSPELHGRDQRGIPRATNCTVGAVEFPTDPPEPANPSPLPNTGAMASGCQLVPWASAVPRSRPRAASALGLLAAAVLFARRARSRNRAVR